MKTRKFRKTMVFPTAVYDHPIEVERPAHRSWPTANSVRFTTPEFSRAKHRAWPPSKLTVLLELELLDRFIEISDLDSKVSKEVS